MIEGFYFDPWHGGCLRRISKIGKNQYKIHGVYGNDDNLSLPRNVEYHPEPSTSTNKYWFATIQVDATVANLQYLNVDFGGKPGKKRMHYRAVYDSKKRVIRWDDSNKWKQMYFHKKQLF